MSLPGSSGRDVAIFDTEKQRQDFGSTSLICPKMRFNTLPCKWPLFPLFDTHFKLESSFRKRSFRSDGESAGVFDVDQMGEQRLVEELDFFASCRHS